MYVCMYEVALGFAVVNNYQPLLNIHVIIEFEVMTNYIYTI